MVFAVTGDMVLQPVFAAAEKLAEAGIGSRIVAVVNPRRLYRPTDVLWDSVSEPDGRFMGDDAFRAMFHGDVLIGVTGGPSAPLEPVLLRSQAGAARRVLLEARRNHRQPAAAVRLQRHERAGDARARAGDAGAGGGF